MYTNIPEELVRSIEGRVIYRNTLASLKKFLNAVSLVFNSIYFKFDNRYFKQIFGMLMGSPLSPILADSRFRKSHSDERHRYSSLLSICG